MTVELSALGVPGDVGPWEAVGFRPDADGTLAFGNGAITFGFDHPSLVVVADVAPAPHVDGVSLVEGAIAAPAEHPNGAFELDHVVLVTDSLERTSAAVAQVLGLERRRVRETDTVRQAFHRFPGRTGSRGCIIEIVENPRVDRASLWGVVLNVADMDTALGSGGELVGRAKPAVQPGRRIATVRSSAGLGVAVALMTN